MQFAGNSSGKQGAFYTIDVLDEAISKGKKVSFIYNSYGTDKKLHPKREREYVINPYQMVATNGRYYLICNYDKYDTLSNYRIDRITGIFRNIWQNICICLPVKAYE